MAEVVITQGRAQLVVQEGEKNDVVLFLNPPSTIELSQGGPQGPPGPGFPSSGTTGDVLIKVGSGYYDSSWTKDLVVDTLSVRTTATGTISPGQFRWNPTEHTVDMGQLRGVVNQIGQETTMVCLNTSAVTIGDGKPVMFTGTDEATNHPTIGPMIANGTVPGRFLFGVSTEAILPGEEGYVTIFGKVRGLDTSIYPNQSILYVDPANPGQWTMTEPPPPALKLDIAVVIKSHPTEGVILVRATPGQDLSECHDVNADVGYDEEVLAWNDNNQFWEPKALPNVAPRSITIVEPLVGDSFTLFRTSRQTTITSAVGLVAGITPAVGYEIRYAANRTSSGTTAVGPSIASSTTVGSGGTIQNMPIPSGNYVWVNVTSVSGVPSEFNLSLAF